MMCDFNKNLTFKNECVEIRITMSKGKNLIHNKISREKDENCWLNNNSKYLERENETSS